VRPAAAPATPSGDNAGVAEGPAIVLIDGEHHPAAVRDALDALATPVAGVVLCGGEEKLPPGPLAEVYGRPVEEDPEAALRRLAPSAGVVVDLADEPVHGPTAKLDLAALALHLGLTYEAPGLRLTPPSYAPVPGEAVTLAVIGTGKRTGKTAVAGHWASLLRGERPTTGRAPLRTERSAPGPAPLRSERPVVVVCMGRGGPAEPVVASPDTTLDDLLTLADRGRHAASDYLEDAVLAGVTTVGCRRVGGGLAGEPAASNVIEGAALAASLDPGAIVFEGSGSCIPPVAVDCTVCVVGAGAGEPMSRYRLLRADLVVAQEGAAAPPDAVRFALRPEPAQPPPPDARVALFTTGATECDGVEPAVVSTNLARRAALADDVERALAAGCDTWLTELKAAAIEVVARRARQEGVRVIFVRNRPVGLDAALLDLFRDAR
jgi:cyclic 2,3-diphosphoglycerate synthase